MLTIEGKTRTPFGWMPTDLIPKIQEKCGITFDESVDEWSIQAQHVNCLKVTVNKDDEEETETVNMWLPIRYYNFLYYLTRIGQDSAEKIKKAIELTDESYLPGQKGYSSYSALLTSAASGLSQPRGKTKDELIWDAI